MHTQPRWPSTLEAAIKLLTRVEVRSHLQTYITKFLSIQSKVKQSLQFNDQLKRRKLDQTRRKEPKKWTMISFSKVLNQLRLKSKENAQKVLQTLKEDIRMFKLLMKALDMLHVWYLDKQLSHIYRTMLKDSILQFWVRKWCHSPRNLSKIWLLIDLEKLPTNVCMRDANLCH